MATGKFIENIRNGKVRCVGYTTNERDFTLGKVYEVKDDHITNDRGYEYQTTNVMKYLSGWYVFEPVADEKIVITHDGNTTTATKYCADGSKVTATARRAPEDEFGCNVGAKLAFDRLMEKVTVVTSGGFKVGDRVNHGGYNGTVKCIKEDGVIGVEFDLAGVGMHNCSGFKLIAGDYPTRHNSRWFKPDHLTHGEVDNSAWTIVRVGYKHCIRSYCYKTKDKTAKVGMEIVVPVGKYNKELTATVVDVTPGEKYIGEFPISDMKEINIVEVIKYFNGKVVCVNAGNVPENLTVGRIYTFVDGNGKSDRGNPITARPVKDCNDLNGRFIYGVKFIPIVE